MRHEVSPLASSIIEEQQARLAAAEAERDAADAENSRLRAKLDRICLLAEQIAAAIRSAP